MDQLQQARAQIDEIDAKMAALFEQRMQAVGQVAQYKARTGKQVFDPAREALVLEKNTARVQNPELQPYYREFLKKALAVSRAYQHVRLGRMLPPTRGWRVRGPTLRCVGCSPLPRHRRTRPGTRWWKPWSGARLTAAFCRLKIPTRAMFPLCWTCCMPTPA